MSDYIIEQGNYYIKYNNGIMMQWGAIIVTDVLTTQMGSVYRTANAQNITFPKEFINNNHIILTTPMAALNSFYIAVKSKTGFNGYPITYTSTSTSAQRYVFWLAIGYWK